MADDVKDEAKATNREIITINVGGAGLGIGKRLLTQYCAERGLSSEGKKTDQRSSDDTLSIQFNESTKKGQYNARSLMIDMDPYAINNIRNTFEYKSLLNADYVINGKRDACCNFAIARYTNGKAEMYDVVNEQIRNIADSCDNIQGFIINHGISGGCGTGLTASILEHLAANYKNKTVAMYSTMHDETFLSHPTMVYNALLLMNYMKDKCDYSVILDNRALYNIVQNQLKIKTPRFKHYNCILSKLISSITSTSRYNINQCKLDTITQQMIPFPKLKYLTSSMWPIIPQSQEKQTIFKNDVQSLVNQCTQSKNFMVQTSDFDVEEDRSIAIDFIFRGKVEEQKAKESLTWIQKQKKVMFADKSKTKQPTLQFDASLASKLPDDDIITSDKLVSMLANNTWISRLFTERIAKIYDLLYSQRAYVHCYVGEGFEQKEFTDARENIGFLEKDYYDILSD